MERRSKNRLQPEEFRQRWIADAAYYRARNRAFAAGGALEDWLEAEKEFNAMLINRYLANVAEDDDDTTIIGLQKLAQTMGLEESYKIHDKKILIHFLQKATGKDPCFQTGSASSTICDQHPDCLWRYECKKLMARWL